MFKTAIPAAILIVVCAACGEGDRTIAPGVRDSAGIRIVESSGPLWGEGDAWRLSEEPVVDIGGGGAPEQQLFRVTGATRLDDGAIVVANDGSGQLLFFDGIGNFRFAAGGRGAGPGEFGDQIRVWRRAGDTLAVFDLGNRRLSFFDDRGSFARSVTLREGTFPIVVGVMDDGRFITSHSLPDDPRPESQPVGYRFRSSLQFEVYLPDGTRENDLARLPYLEQVVTEWGGSKWPNPPAFAHVSRYTATSNALYYSSTDEYEVLRFVPDSGLVSILRVQRPPRQVTTQDIEAYKRERMRSAPSDPAGRQEWQRALDAGPYPSQFPTFRSLVVDSEEHVWALLYAPYPDTTAQCMVFDGESGRLLGTVGMPARFTPYQIGSDYVLGLWRDVNDVEHVRVYGLVKLE